jgi:hypothetical protein
MNEVANNITVQYSNISRARTTRSGTPRAAG